VGDKRGEAMTLFNLSRVNRLSGQSAAALEFGEQALVAVREAGDRWLEADILYQLALFLVEMDRIPDAIMTLERSVTLARVIGHVELEAHRAKLEELRARSP
jgi:hypothetical protein